MLRQGVDEQISGYVFSFVIVASCTRMVSYFRIFKKTRYYLNLFVNVTISTLPFFFIFFYATIAFAIIYQTLDIPHSDDYYTY